MNYVLNLVGSGGKNKELKSADVDELVRMAVRQSRIWLYVGMGSTEAQAERQVAGSQSSLKDSKGFVKNIVVTLNAEILRRKVQVEHTLRDSNKEVAINWEQVIDRSPFGEDLASPAYSGLFPQPAGWP